MENPHDTLSSPEEPLLSLGALKTTMEEIIHSDDDQPENEKRPQSPQRRKSMSDLKTQKLDCELLLIQSEFLCDVATLSYSAYRNINSILTRMDDDENALNAQKKYFKSLEAYCSNYRENCFAAFAYIPKVLEYILEIEQMRKRNKKDLYEPSQKCKELIPVLEQIVAQEKDRRNKIDIQHIRPKKELRNSFR